VVDWEEMKEDRVVEKADTEVKVDLVVVRAGQVVGTDSYSEEEVDLVLAVMEKVVVVDSVLD